MKRVFLLILSCLSCLTWSAFAQTTYSTPGSYTFTAGSGYAAVAIDMAGAQGGSSGGSAPGGKGGRVQAKIAVTPGQVLYINVGGAGTTQSYCVSRAGGSNGGGNGYGYGGGGGGMSDIRKASGAFSLTNEYLVAGGGGGAGYNYGNNTEIGGYGGGLTGGVGYQGSPGAPTPSLCGSGGSQTAGGSGATSYGVPGGTAGQGGSATGSYCYSGGGGGGYYGGGSGAYGGGGGGSSYISGTGVSAATTTQDYQSGNGYVIVTPLPPSALSTPSSLPFGAVTTGTTSSSIVFSLVGSSLTGASVTVTPPANFRISPDGITWYTSSSPYTQTYSGDNFTTLFFAQFQPTAAISYTGNITVTGGGIPTAYNIAVSGNGASACSGTPSAGTASISPSSGNSSTAITLSTSGTTSAGGLTYQWQSSPTISGTYTDVPGAVATPYTFTGLSSTRYYRLAVTCPTFTTAVTNTVSATFTLPSSSCTPTSYTNCSGCGFYVGNGTGQPVTITGAAGTLTDAAATSVASSVYYADRTGSLNVTFTPGSTYVATVGGLTTNQISWSIWIDFNNNGSFDNATELVGGVAHYSNSSVRAALNLAIPATAPPGAYRLRIVMNYDAGQAPGANTSYPCYPLQNPCPSNLSSNVYYADTRDYLAIIAPPPPSLTATNMPGFGNVTVNTNSVPVGYTALTGVGLIPSTGYVTATAPSNFMLSLDGVTWGSSINVAYTGGILSSKNLYVRFSPTAATSYSGNIAITGGGISSTVNVAVSGTGNATVCSGSPSAGSAAASPTSGGPTTAFTLSLSGATAAGGLFYQWQSSPNGTTWTNIAGGEFPTYSFTGVFANTQYRCIVTCGTGASATSSAVTVTYSASGSLTAPSCTSGWSSYAAACTTYNMWMRASITGSSGSIADAAACNSTGYLNQTGLAAPTLNSGGTYSMTCTTGPSYGQYNQVYIDFNNDGTFQTTESVGGQGTGSANTNTFNIVIPSGVTSGVRRMRVIGSYNGNGVTYPNILPCTPYSYGETRDYSVNILGSAPPCSGQPKGGIVSGTPISSCTAFTSTLFNVGETSAPGISYQWQSSTSPTSGFTNITGATNAVYNPTLSTVGTVYYLNKTTCANGSLSSSTPAQAVTFLAAPASITGTTTICQGSTTTLANASSGGIWSSSNSSVAAIGSSSGIVSGVSAGSATITYTAPSGCFATTAFVVNPQPAAVTGAAPVCGGTLPTTVTLSDATSGGTWSSSSSAIASVSSTSGVVTGVSGGTVTITYQLPSGCISTAAITVNAVAPITGASSVCIGYTSALSNSTGGGTWSSSNTSVATVSSTGVVTSVSLGSTVITYNVASIGCSAIQTVFVTNPPTPFTVTGGGTYCAGGTGVSVGLNSSDAGITYTLFNGAAPVATATGTGGSINFGLFTGAGTYGVIGNYGTPCATTMLGTATVSVNPLPTAYSVTGTGAYCTGGAGLHVYLSSSAIGINYQLMLGTTPIGTPIAGTSASIDFGLVTSAGTYTVIATNGTTSCINSMAGSAVISINPLPTSFSVTGGGGFCAGSTGVNVGLSGSVVGTNYQLLIGGTPSGTPLAGTGSALNFGIQTTGGTYTVLATNTATSCVGNMSGSATVTVNALPTVFNVIGGGLYCVGGTGVAVGLNGSTSGVNYQLYSGTTPMGSPVSGTGAAITFGLQTLVGSYTVIATNATTGCINTMFGSVSVATNPLPSIFNVTGGGGYCAGGAGVVVGLSGSTLGVTYQLFNGSTLVGAGSGTGFPISFGLQLAAGTYTVVGTNPITGCINSMSGSVSIVINPLPTVFTVTSVGTNYCAGGTGIAVGLSGSTSGVNYQLYNAGVPVGSPVAGTGSAISFGLQTLAGAYTVVAVNASTTCTMNMAGSVVIIINPLPTTYTVTGGGGYCAGGTGVPVGLTASNTGISYQLMSGSTAVGTALAGTGSALFFGAITTGGTYTVVATNPSTGCVATMSGSAVVTINSLPTVFTLNSAGTDYCSGGAGVVFGLGGSVTGVNYQLYNGSVATGGAVAGTGSAISFGPQMAAGTYTAKATNATTGCTNNMAGSITLNINPLPGTFAVTGGGNFCAGGTGVVVGLSGSATGISYQLMNGLAAVGSPVAGTGGPLNFGLVTGSGSYTVVATNTVTGCMNTMTGSAIVNANPLPGLYTISGGGNYCTGGTGVHVGLAGSATGISYQLFVGGSPTGAPMAGTGLSLDFGLKTAPGTYEVVGTNTLTGCLSLMTGSTTIVVNTLPALQTVTGGGNYCTGGTGVVIGLSGSNTGVNYQLYNGAIAMGAAVPGATGSPISFGAQTAVGIYTVVATNTTTTCSGNMTGSVSVGLHPLPTIYNVMGGGSYCNGGAGVNISLSGSNAGIVYQLYNGTSLVSAMPGTGLALDFGPQATVGTYTVVATNVSTSCTNNMSGSAVVAINPLPAAFAVTGGGNYCAGGTGTHVGLGGSVSGVTYQLYNSGIPSGASITGTGSAIDFGLKTAPGTYTVVATNVTTGCTNTMTGAVTINVNPLPGAYTVAGGGNFCSGGSGVDITLSGSDAGVTYQLYNGATMMGASMTGTGMAIDFGLQTVAGTYTVVATDLATMCTSNMTGSISVSISALPTAYVVGGGGNYCAGTPGVHVTLSGSSTGVTYQLMNGSGPIGGAVIGTGSALDFGLQTAPGNYTVVATNTATTCTSNMTGSVTVGINSLPIVFSVTGGGSSYCAGGSGVNIVLNSSETGVSYQLYNGVTTMGSPLAGTGSSLNLGYWMPAGSYTVVGVNASTGCSSNMSGAVSISVNPLPVVFPVTGGGSYCNGGSGVHVGLGGSTVGISYQLFRGVTNVGLAMTGFGGPIDFGLQLTPGSYTVVATNVSTGCTNNMGGAVLVAVNAAPAIYAVTGGGNYCAGGTGVHVNLSGSSLGVSYKLYRNGVTLVGSAVAGTGAPLDFGLHTSAGTYTVVATNVSSSCTSNMTGSAVVVINPAPVAYTVTGGGNYCPGGTGVHVGLSGSAAGITYQLFKGTTAVGSSMAGTGSGLDFGLQTASGVYTVVATNGTTGCTNTMSGSVNVVINTLPTAYSVVGGGSFCNSGAGVHVGLSGSDVGVDYKLYSSFTLAATLPGTGGPIDFGLQTTGGNYTVIAANSTTGCSSNMTGSATVTVISSVYPNVSITSSAGDTMCSGTFVTFTANILNGGTTPSYSWSVNGVTAGATATYSYIPVNGDVVSVTLTSSEMCATPTSVSASMDMTVDPQQAPTVSVSANPGTLVCQGTSVTYTAVAGYGGTTPTFAWIKNGSTVGTSSTYSYIPANGDDISCVLTSNYHCRTANTANSAHLTMDVATATIPVVTITANPGLNIAAGQAATFTATVANGGPAPTYQWAVNGTPEPGATSATFVTSNLANGDIVSCNVLSSGGCPGLLGTKAVTVHVYGVGVQQVSASSSDIKLLPNPNKGVFTVKGTLGIANDEEVTLEITNMLGQVIYNAKTTVRNGELNERIQLNGTVANGMYILSLRAGAEHKVFHIVVEQ